MPKATASAVTDMLTAEMVNTAAFIIVERSQMDEILKEQNFQMSGCTDQACAVKIGKVISARKILIGSVSKVGETFTIAVRMVDVERGEAEGGATERVKSDSDLPEAAERIAKQLTDRITGREEPAEQVQTYRPEKRVEPEKYRQPAGDTIKKALSVLFSGNIPFGLSLSYTGYSPSNSLVSDYYSSMMGAGLGYIIPSGLYFAWTAGADFVTSSDDKSGDSRMSFNTYSLGARLGFPILKILYPYCGLSVKGTWLSEKGENDSANFLGFGAGFSYGIALTFSSWGLYVEKGNVRAEAKDETSTDISGSAFGIGIIFKL